jgi:hypothetical protein
MWFWHGVDAIAGLVAGTTGDALSTLALAVRIVFTTMGSGLVLLCSRSLCAA